MEKDILKLLPQKAFRLISIKETLKISVQVTQSLIDKKDYLKNYNLRKNNWKFEDIKIVTQFPPQSLKPSTKEHGEKILRIYFAQFYDHIPSVHLDLRQGYFYVAESFLWLPSNLQYEFSPSFTEGVCSLYEGFYLDIDEKFEKGLSLLGILQDWMGVDQKKEIAKLFYDHFGEGKATAVRFSLKNLQESFNTIFTYFLKKDIPLNPEFAVLGSMLVTMYTTLQEINFELSAKDAFVDVFEKYKQKS